VKITNFNGNYEIDSKYAKYWGNRIPLTSYENYFRIFSKLKNKGIIGKLEDKGIKEGDMITIKGTPYSIEYWEN
jgi:Obg family GTPase CgtA-like protein